jgi:hypothetical protein
VLATTLDHRARNHSGSADHGPRGDRVVCAWGTGRLGADAFLRGACVDVCGERGQQGRQARRSDHWVRSRRGKVHQCWRRPSSRAVAPALQRVETLEMTELSSRDGATHMERWMHVRRLKVHRCCWRWRVALLNSCRALRLQRVSRSRPLMIERSACDEATRTARAHRDRWMRGRRPKVH